MPLYMSQFAFTSQAMGAFARQPEDRSEGARRLAESLGGRLHNLYYCFGEYDAVVQWEFPDDETAAAAILAIVSPGHLKVTKTTKLLTVTEMMGAMKKAGAVTYRGPAGQGST